jgi:transposase
LTLKSQQMNIKKAKKGPAYKYDAALRRKIVEELLSGTILISHLQKKYNIGGCGTIMRWVKEFQDEDQNLLSSGMEKPQDKNSDANKEKTFQDLEAELKLARLKIIALETMIDVAEEQLNIEIRKKSGTKPSSE